MKGIKGGKANFKFKTRQSCYTQRLNNRNGTPFIC